MFSDPAVPVRTAQTVRRLAHMNRLPQSVMLTGGSPKLRERCAAELAAAALCRAPRDGEACGKCPACLKVKAGTHPDLIRIAPPANRKTVPIETVRQLVLEKLNVAPNEADNKIYLFPDAENLSPVIQNALLKSVEEPPPFVGFLFLCSARETMLPTVISRCTELPLGAADGAAKKKEERAAEIAAEIAEALYAGSDYELMLSTAPMVRNRELMKMTAARLTLILRDAMAGDTGAAFLSGADRQALGLASRCAPAQLLRMKAAMDRIREDAEHNANENLLLSEFSARLIEARKPAKPL